MRLYEDPSDQAAFERWVDITAQLLQKYGPVLLKQKRTQAEQRYNMENISPLESEKEAA